MTLTLDEDDVLSATIAGVPRVAELIAIAPAEERTRAEKERHQETSHGKGFLKGLIRGGSKIGRREDRVSLVGIG